MKVCAEAMIKIEDIFQTLCVQDRNTVAYEVWRTHGNTETPNGRHRSNTRRGGGIGGSSVSPKVRDPKKQQQAIDLLEFLNLKASRSFRPVEENLRFLRARLNTATPEDIRGVIARKTREWANTPQAKYLRPATLFNAEKFEQYIGEQNT